MYKPITLKDIARALDLSPSTVSRALHDDYQISTATKKLVIDYAKTANYQCNPNALSLKNKRSYSIGIVVPEVANSFFSQAIAGIESIAYNKGYHTIITQTYDSPERESANINHLANSSVDGLLISISSGATDYEYIKNLHDDGLPVVFFDRVINDIETFKVVSDNFNGAYKATESLIKAGCKSIAFLANAPQLPIINERLSGYTKALNDYHIPYQPHLIKNFNKVGNDYQEVDDAVAELLSLDEKPDGIFMSSDRVTIAGMRALNKFEFFQHEILIAGFSNSNVVDLLKPPISYIRQNAFELGEIAIEMLLRLIESKRPITEFETRTVDSELHNIYQHQH